MYQYIHAICAKYPIFILQESALVTYHSKFNEGQVELACGFPMLPITAKDGYNADQKTHDIVDEAICQFRANILFKNYKVQGPGDKVIVYLTAFIQKCMEQMFRFPQPDKAKTIIGMIVKDL